MSYILLESKYCGIIIIRGLSMFVCITKIVLVRWKLFHRYMKQVWFTVLIAVKFSVYYKIETYFVHITTLVYQQ